MIQSDITTICTGKSKRSDAISLANFKLSLNRVLEMESKSFLLSESDPPHFLTKDKDLLIVDGDYYKDLESDFLCLATTEKPVTLIGGSDETPMVKKSREWFVDHYPIQSHADASKEEPYYYYLDQGRIYFNKSNGSFTIRVPYAFIHAALTGDSSTIYFPDSYKMLLAHLTLADFYDDLDNTEKRDNHLALAQVERQILGLANHLNSSIPRSTQYNDF